MRVLVTGWPSFLHGEATAGDVLSMRTVGEALAGAGIRADTAWSPGYLPGALHLGDADPCHYTHLLFTCGPAHGEQVEWLHARYAACRRIAVGVSVLDPADPAVTGFHRVLARDGDGPPVPDLSTSADTRRVPVTGIVLAPGQREYGERRRHEEVHRTLREWLAGLGCAPVPLDTRLAPDWWHCTTGDELVSLLERLDVVVTTRLHGLVLALRAGVPALAVDPVAGGGKVTAQADALGWPAVVPASEVRADRLRFWWDWCRSAEARERAAGPLDATRPLVGALLEELRTCAPRS